MLGAKQLDYIAKGVLMAMQGPFKREITEEQYRDATEKHEVHGVFSMSEVCGYGVYSERYFEENGKYYVEFELGSSCD